MTLDDLRESAPRTFDKTLVDLIVAVQNGHAPIVTEPAGINPEIGGALLQVIQRVQALEENAQQASQVISTQNVRIVDLMQRLSVVEYALSELARVAAEKVAEAA